MRILHRMLDGLLWCYLIGLKAVLWCILQTLMGIIHALSWCASKVFFGCFEPFIETCTRTTTVRDRFIKQADKRTEYMKELQEDDPKIAEEYTATLNELADTLVRLQGDLTQSRTYSCVRPGEYVVKKGAPPYPVPERVWKYVDDYYTKLWKYNSCVCSCCKKRKPAKDFKTKRYDYRRKGLIQHSSNCRECLKGYKEYVKALGFIERLFCRVDNLLLPYDEEILKHNKWISALSKEELDGLR